MLPPCQAAGVHWARPATGGPGCPSPRLGPGPRGDHHGGSGHPVTDSTRPSVSTVTVSELNTEDTGRLGSGHVTSPSHGPAARSPHRVTGAAAGRGRAAAARATESESGIRSADATGSDVSLSRDSGSDRLRAGGFKRMSWSGPGTGPRRVLPGWAGPGLSLALAGQGLFRVNKPGPLDR